MYESLKPLGILSIVIGWLSMLFLIYYWSGDKSMSFSRHAAAHRSAYLMMAISESVFLPMYLVFIATWFTYTYNLPFIFIVLNAISVIGLLIAAWVPDVVGIRGRIHHAVAYPAYMCMTLSALILTASETVSVFARVFSFCAFTFMIVGSYFLVKHEKGKANFLYIQGAFLASIHLSIIFTTYIR